MAGSEQRRADSEQTVGSATADCDVSSLPAGSYRVAVASTLTTLTVPLAAAAGLADCR